MDTSSSDIAAAFDARAPKYNGNDWHRLSAARLVEFCALRHGSKVLDAGTGTGFAAISAARAIGPEGHIVAVDLSAGMLRVAQEHRLRTSEARIQWVQGDAVNLSTYSAASFDAVLCSAALLYMPVAEALAEWHRLLVSGLRGSHGGPRGHARSTGGDKGSIRVRAHGGGATASGLSLDHESAVRERHSVVASGAAVAELHNNRLHGIRASGPRK
jgi:SAM-dependent methyltransferase